MKSPISKQLTASLAYFILPAILTAFPSRGNAEARDAAERNVTAGRLWERTGYAATADPALRGFRLPFSTCRGSVGWQRLTESEPADIQQGDGKSAGHIGADAYIHNGETTLWGEATFMTGKIYGLRWNETPESDRTIPYMIADSVGGNLREETYRFSGGYSHVSKRLAWGAEGGYTARLSYRAVDPRPRNVSGDLTVRAGVAPRITGDYYLGLSGGYNRFRVSTEIEFVSDLGNARLLHLTGLGTRYYRFDGTGSDVYSDCHSVEGGLSLFPAGGRGFFGHARFTEEWMRHVLRDLNKLPLARMTRSMWDFSLGWRGVAGNHRLAAEAGWRNDRRNGRETFFGDAASGSYPEIGSAPMYAENRMEGDLRLVWQWEREGASLGLSPTLGWERRKAVYATPFREWFREGMRTGITARGDLRAGKKVNLTAEVRYNFHTTTDSSLHLPEPTDETDAQLQEMVRHNFGGATADLSQITVRAAATYSISSRYAIGIDLSCLHGNLSGFGHHDGWNASAIFLF